MEVAGCRQIKPAYRVFCFAFENDDTTTITKRGERTLGLGSGFAKVERIMQTSDWLWRVKTAFEMTYTVSGGALNSAQPTLEPTNANTSWGLPVLSQYEKMKHGCEVNNMCEECEILIP